MDKAKEKEFWQDKLQVVSSGNFLELEIGISNEFTMQVLTIFRGEKYLVIRRQTRRNEAQKVIFKMSEISRVDDGIWYTNGFRIRGED